MLKLQYVKSVRCGLKNGVMLLPYGERLVQFPGNYHGRSQYYYWQPRLFHNSTLRVRLFQKQPAHKGRLII